MTLRLGLRILVVLVLAAIPAALEAQRRTRGEAETDWKAIDKALPKTTLKLSNKDVENMSPMKLLIDKRKDIKLTDDQLKQCKDIESALRERNEPLYSVLDSLRNEMKPIGRSPEDDRARAIIARTGLTNLMAAFKTSYQTSQDAAVALMDEEQKKTAMQLLAAHQSEVESMLREKLGGR